MDTPGTSNAFEALVGRWVYTEYVLASDWGEPWLVVMDHAGRSELTDAVCQSFPRAGPVGTLDAVVCPEFVAELCAWYDMPTGPSVVGQALGSLAGVARMGPDAVVAAVAKVARTLGQVPVATVLDVVGEVGAVAQAHGLTLGDGVELVRAGEHGLELVELDVVLSVVLDGREGR